jgi:hypothetical protein
LRRWSIDRRNLNGKRRRATMTDLKNAHQTGGGQSGMTPQDSQGEGNQDAEFGTSERGTRGSNRDADRSGESKNQGHGHPREERGDSRE